jgi:hypothetical protein
MDKKRSFGYYSSKEYAFFTSPTKFRRVSVDIDNIGREQTG